MGVVARRFVDPESTDWMNDPGVKCRGRSDLFYPDRPSSDVRKAQAVCNGLDGGPICPRRKDCGRYAIDHRENHGVWGGMSERDRRKVQRARRLRQDLEIYTLEDVKFPGRLVVTRRRVQLTLVRTNANKQGSAFRSNVSGK